MVSQYSVIQYVPDPIADERINIGVLVFDDNVVRVQFLKNWKRVKDFSFGDIQFLFDFEQEMNKASTKNLLFPGDKMMTDTSKQDRLLRVSQNWMNSIQFTEPHASLKPVDKLFQDSINRYLQEPEKEKNTLRNRKQAAQIIKTRFSTIMSHKFSKKEVQNLLHPKYQYQGSKFPHTLDVTVANGKPYFAAQAISFEVKTTETLIMSTYGLVIDIMEKDPDFQLGIVTLPPKEHQPHYKDHLKKYRKTRNIYQDNGATVLEERELDSWITENLDSVPSDQ